MFLSKELLRFLYIVVRGNEKALQKFQYQISDFRQNISKNVFSETFKNTFWDTLKKP